MYRLGEYLNDKRERDVIQVCASLTLSQTSPGFYVSAGQL